MHLLLELALPHLPVRDEEAQLWAELLQLLRRLFDRLDAVVQVERLAAALDLALERLPSTSSSSYSPTYVRIGRRPSGGVSMTEMSRSPESDMCSVRGIGVAESASTSTSSRSCAQQLLLRDAEALLLVDDHEPELLRDHVAREHAVRPDQHVDLAVRGSRQAPASTSFGGCGSARPSRHAQGSRGSGRGTCSSAAARAPSSARASAPACR